MGWPLGGPELGRYARLAPNLHRRDPVATDFGEGPIGLTAPLAAQRAGGYLVRA
jgi:hypothetical protein